MMDIERIERLGREAAARAGVKLLEIGGRVAIRNSYRDCWTLYIDVTGPKPYVEAASWLHYAHDDEIAARLNAAFAGKMETERWSPLVGQCVEDYDQLRIASGARFETEGVEGMPRVDEISLATGGALALHGIVNAGKFEGRSLYISDNGRRKVLHDVSKLYSLVKPCDVLDAIRAHIRSIRDLHGAGRVWFAGDPVLVRTDVGYPMVHCDDGPRILLRTYYGHEAQAVVDEPVPIHWDGEKYTANDVPLTKPERWTTDALAPAVPLTPEQIREQKIAAIAPWSVRFSVERMEARGREPEYANVPRAEDGTHAMARLDYISEEAARRAWSRRLRELQAEARRKEREQVVIDLESVE